MLIFANNVVSKWRCLQVLTIMFAGRYSLRHIFTRMCTVPLKQRLCGSGMRWKDKGAKVILSLRALVQSKGRWQQFWGNIEQYGAQVCS